MTLRVNGTARTVAQRLLRRDYRSDEVRNILRPLDDHAQWTRQPSQIVWTSLRAGLQVIANARTSIIECISMRAAGIDANEAFELALPYGLQFDLGRVETRARLGTPVYASATHDGWLVVEGRLLVEFEPETGKMASVTLTTVSWL